MRYSYVFFISYLFMSVSYLYQYLTQLFFLPILFKKFKGKGVTSSSSSTPQQEGVTDLKLEPKTATFSILQKSCYELSCFSLFFGLNNHKRYLKCICYLEVIVAIEGLITDCKSDQ